MSDSVNLSPDELGSLLGGEDIIEDSNTQDKRTTNEQFRNLLDSLVPGLKQFLSSSLNEEIEFSLSDLEPVSGIVYEEGGEYYISTGTFTNNGPISHSIIIPSTVAHEMVVKYTGVADTDNSADEITGPLSELFSNFSQNVAEGIGNSFKSQLDNFELRSDTVEDDTAYLKLTWELGENKIYEFYQNSILQYLSNNGESEDTGSQIDASDNSVSEDASGLLGDLGDIGEETGGLGDSTEEDASGLLGDIGEESTNAEESSGLASGIFGGLGDEDSDSMSLGDALLGGESVSDVSMPSFDGHGTPAKKEGAEANSIKMLLDVSMDVTVELGKTKKLVGEILDLNRGSIIELKKLAGEPLDVKVNNKLIAKGEVVVIDEYFGVRIIEVVSPYERQN